MNREKIIKKIGKIGEDIATEYLIKNSYNILHRNFHSQFGEIDIIAEKDSTIYFFEVKTRTENSFTQPEESITRRKITRIIKTAQIFFQKTLNSNHHKYGRKSWRISLIGIILGRPTYTYTQADTYTPTDAHTPTDIPKPIYSNMPPGQAKQRSLHKISITEIL